MADERVEDGSGSFFRARPGNVIISLARTLPHGPTYCRGSWLCAQEEHEMGLMSITCLCSRPIYSFIDGNLQTCTVFP